jgi:hypothetical protein
MPAVSPEPSGLDTEELVIPIPGVRQMRTLDGVDLYIEVGTGPIALAGALAGLRGAQLVDVTHHLGCLVWRFRMFGRSVGG